MATLFSIKDEILEMSEHKGEKMEDPEFGSPKKEWVTPTIDYLGDIGDFVTTHDNSSLPILIDAIIEKIKKRRHWQSK